MACSLLVKHHCLQTGLLWPPCRCNAAGVSPDNPSINMHEFGCVFESSMSGLKSAAHLLTGASAGRRAVPERRCSILSFLTLVSQGQCKHLHNSCHKYIILSAQLYFFLASMIAQVGMKSLSPSIGQLLVSIHRAHLEGMKWSQQCV